MGTVKKPEEPVCGTRFAITPDAADDDFVLVVIRMPNAGFKECAFAGPEARITFIHFLFSSAAGVLDAVGAPRASSFVRHAGHLVQRQMVSSGAVSVDKGLAEPELAPH